MILQRLMKKRVDEKWGAGYHIAVIDDDYPFAAIFERMLSRSGYEGRLKTFLNGKDFFLKPQAKPDLIICDISMPIMNGFEVKKRLDKDGFNGTFVYCSASLHLLDSSDHNIKITKPLESSSKVIGDIKKWLKK